MMLKPTSGQRFVFLLGLLLATSAALAFPSQAAARKRWVDDDGHAGASGCGASKAAFRKIQEAIDASGVEDVIAICPGVYRQDLVISGIGKKSLRLRGIVPGAAKLRPSRAGGTAPLLRIDQTEGIVISNLVFQAPTAKPCRRVPALVDVDAAGVELSRDIFQPVGANTVGPCGFDVGVDIHSASSVVLSRSTVRDFRLTGVFARDNQTEAFVEDSAIKFFHANEARRALEDTGTAGLYGRDQAAVFFRRNTIGSLKTGGRSTPLLESGIKFYDAMKEAVITGNEVKTVFYGLAITSQDGTIRNNDVRRGRRMLDFDAVGISLSGGERNEVDHNTVRGFHFGAYVDGGATDHLIHDNDFRNNRKTDRVDDTTGGGGTSGTSNFWTDDRGLSDSPDGLCSP